MDRSLLSRVSATCSGSPQVSSTAFCAQPPNLRSASLIDMGFAIICSLARSRRRSGFLYIGSRVCSTLPSDPASQRRPCASLSLHLYQVVKRTFTFKLSSMLGTHKKASRFRERLGGGWPLTRPVLTRLTAEAAAAAAVAAAEPAESAAWWLPGLHS